MNPMSTRWVASRRWNGRALVATLLVVGACWAETLPAEPGMAVTDAPHHAELELGEPVAASRSPEAWRWDWDAWDRDGSGAVEVEEWEASLLEVHRSWDADGDELLAAAELAEAWLAWWDGDGDGAVRPDEWSAPFVASLGAGPRWGRFVTWDLDGDGLVAEEELSAVLADLGLFEAWDVDGDRRLGPHELEQGWLDAWDLDRDDVVTADEWGWGPPVHR